MTGTAEPRGRNVRPASAGGRRPARGGGLAAERAGLQNEVVVGIRRAIDLVARTAGGADGLEGRAGGGGVDGRGRNGLFELVDLRERVLVELQGVLALVLDPELLRVEHALL